MLTKGILTTSRLDLGVNAVILALIVAIVGTVAAGDRVGVNAALVQNDIHTTSPIRLNFDEPMDTASVESNFSIDPPVAGRFSWSGQQLTFMPSTALLADQTYTVTIRAGAASVQGRTMIDEARWTFHVGRPKIVYLAPATLGYEPSNLWLIDPAVPFEPKQLTNSHIGVLDYRVSPDGTQIVYAAQASDGTADLYLIPSSGGTPHPLTRCEKALCQSPDWSPDGLRIVYERRENNADLPQLDRGVGRAWVLNLKDLSTSPLLPESQMLGHAPQWSPDGTQIAVYDKNLGGIAIYDTGKGSSKFIKTLVEETGKFDPGGSRLVFAQLITTPQQFYNAFVLADLANPDKGLRTLNGRDNAPVDDRQAAWTPDGKKLAITRRYIERPTPCGPQVYLLDPENGSAEPLVPDPNFVQGAISWNPAGDQLLMQRWACTETDAQPGIWILDMQTKKLQQVAHNGYLPQWVP